MSQHPLHVVICNERLLPRFGVDRLLLLLGAGMLERGHRITFLCVRCDRQAVEAITPAMIQFTPARLDIDGAENDAALWLDRHWEQLSEISPPDLIVTGGWPFFGAGRVGIWRDVPTVFIDAGAVPHDGLPEGAVHAQRAVRRLRAAALPRFSAVLPISRFIRDTQTVPDRGSSAGVTTVLLGADHLDTPLFGAPDGESADSQSLEAITQLADAGHPLILLLGRFEGAGYKNSPASFDVLARILEAEPRARLLILARPGELTPPQAVEHAVVPLGYVSDAALVAVMERCALGLSVSLWEGFNLPLAEMQWHGRPVLAFSVGAHPEVACDPWMLCCSNGEMADKAVSLLRSGLPPHMARGRQFARFRERFSWHGVVDRYANVLESAARRGPGDGRACRRAGAVLIDCTNAAIDPANPGVMRVVRRLGHALQDLNDCLVLFTRWDVSIGAYRMLTRYERETLLTYDGPFDAVGQLFDEAAGGSTVEQLLEALGDDRTTVLFMPEVILDGHMPERLLWARDREFFVAAILYDLIPITHAPFCSADVVRRFPEYLEGLASVDAIFAISAESLQQFLKYCDSHALPQPTTVEVIWLPSQFGSRPRRLSPPVEVMAHEPVTILCVGSIAPRKNHRLLIEAFLALVRDQPELRVQLVLAGHRFGGAEELSDWVDSVCRAEPRIRWTGLVSDEQLADLFERSVFTVYPSLAEGFGLPVVESLWMARPVLCHSEGVMAELAAGGGCLTADMRDPAAITEALRRLVTDAELRRTLGKEAVSRDLLDWSGYAAAIGAELRQLAGGHALDPSTERRTTTSRQRLRELGRRMEDEAQTLRQISASFVDTTDKRVVS